MPLSRRDIIKGGAAAATLLASSRIRAQNSDLTALTILEASELIRSRSISPVDLTNAYLERISQLNPELNAYITVTEQLAREQARAREAELVSGRWRGPLHGIPIALKDNIDTAGVLTTAASELYSDRVPRDDAEVVRRLDEAGAVMLGKANMHEFAFGGTSAVTHYGPVHNPWNLDYIPGGSSGGSAAAVAARLCAGALGTDTAASVRMPAAFCGVVGLKATYGLVSIRGIIPLSESLDHCGPLCRTVADTALMLRVMAGYDLHDVASIPAEIPDYASALTMPISDLTLGLPRTLFFEDLNGEVEQAVESAIELLSGMVAEVREVELPSIPRPVILEEAYAYHRSFLADDQNLSRYQPTILQRLQMGAGLSAADYIQARREIVLARKAISTVFSEVDLLITPTTSMLPLTIEESPGVSPTAQIRVPEPMARNTIPFNIFGIPAISVPCGLSRDGLPIGLQIAGPALAESRVLALAHAYEQATDWHNLQPPI